LVSEKREVFVVCVDHYEQDKRATKNLSGAREVATDFLGLMRLLGFTPGSDIITGTKAEVEQGLKVFARSPAGRKVLYWIGHGVHPFLPCSDWEGVLEGGVVGRAGTLLAEDLGHYLHEAKGDLLTIVDTCGSKPIAVRALETLDAQEEGNRRPGADGRVDTGRSVSVAWTSESGERSRVHTWVEALKAVYGAPSDASARDLWNPYAAEVAAGELLSAVEGHLAERGDTQHPDQRSRGHLGYFFVNPRHEPSAAPALMSARTSALGTEVERIRRSWFPGLRLDRHTRFVGRHQALSGIAHWLLAPSELPEAFEPGRGLLVVTGAPGSGKSALLARVVLLSLGEADAPGEFPHELGGQLLGRITAGLRCLDHSALDCAVELASLLGVSPDGQGWGELRAVVARILEECRERRRRKEEVVLLIDGLDEAERHDVALIENMIIRPLSEEPNVRLLLGTRKVGAVAGLTDPGTATVLDLDADRNRWDDVSDYVTQRLSEGTRYQGEDLKEVARTVSERSGGIFLFADLYCTRIEQLRAPLPPSGQGFANLLTEEPMAVLSEELAALDRTLGWRQGRVASLLLPLAVARGAGLPRMGGVWVEMADAMAPDEDDTSYTSQDVRQLLDVAGAHIETAGVAGQPVYRLQHQLLAEHLVRWSGRSETDLHHLATDVLVRLFGGTRRTRSPVSPYLVRYLAAHARAGRCLGNVLGTAGLAVVLDPERTAVQIDLLRQTDERLESVVAQEEVTPVMELYRSVAQRLVPLTPLERGALLQATALRQRPSLVPWARRSEGVYWSDLWTTDDVTSYSTWVRAPFPNVCAVADPGGRDLFLAAGEGIYVWPVGGGPSRALGFTRTGRDDPIRSLSVAVPESRLALVATDGQQVLLVPRESGDTAVLRWGVPVQDVALTRTPGGVDLLAATTGDELVLWEGSEPRRRRSHRWRPGSAYGVDFVGTANRTLLLGVGDGGAQLWDTETGEEAGAFAEEAGRCTGVSVLDVEGGSWVAVVGTRPPRIRMWWIGPDSVLPTAIDDTLTSSSMLPVALGKLADRPVLAAADGSTVRVWDVVSGKEKASLAGHGLDPRSLAWLGDGRLAVAEGNGTKLWSLREEERIPTPRSSGTMWARNSGTCVSGGGLVGLAGDDRARLWDDAGCHLSDIEGFDSASSVAAAGDNGRLVAVAGRAVDSRPLVRVRDLRTGEGLDLRPPDDTRDAGFTSVALLERTDRIVVYAALGRFVHSWDARTGEPLERWGVPTAKIGQVAAVLGEETDTAFLVAGAGRDVYVQWPDRLGGRAERFTLASEVPGKALSAWDVSVVRRPSGEGWFAVATDQGVHLQPVDVDGATLPPTLHMEGEQARSVSLVAPTDDTLVVVAAGTSGRRLHLWGLRGVGPWNTLTIPYRDYQVHTVRADVRASSLFVFAAGTHRADALSVPTGPTSLLWRNT
jgi:WD40 repeat protein